MDAHDQAEPARAAREPEDEHALLGGLFASVPDVICYKDKNLRFLGGNPAFAELAGRSMADLIGRSCREVFTEEWAARFRAVEPAVLETGLAVRAREWVTYPGGRRALLDFIVTPLRGGTGDVRGLIVVGRDVTERDRLEEALREAQKMEAVGRLAGGVAHDFNNLLTVVIGNLELARGGAPAADAGDVLAAAERAARQAADLTRQMLGFARRQPLRPQVVDLNALVRDGLALLRRSIDPRVAVAFTPTADLPPVTADPVQVQQVLINLCFNARDAMPDGGTLTIETGHVPALPDAAPGAAPCPTGYARLSVLDTGDGMTEDVRAKVFEPFFTTKEVGRGTGLGLASVYGVALAHGGSVGCASTPGRGSRFDVYLPCAAGEPAGADAAAPAPAAAPGRGETVLVADDEPGVRNLARTGLERQGYRVLLAADGADAVEVFRREGGRVGLVVLDATMPNMTGREAFDLIREIDARVPVIFASGFPVGQLLPNPPPARTAFLNKPYTPSQLAAEVRRLLDPATAPGG